jgi:predicted GNAT family acetyltransferase
VTAPPDDLEIVDNPDESRYEARLGGRVVGISQYELGDRRITFLHTEVDPSVEGRGIGSRLARGVLADARARNLGVTALCPFIAAFLRRHHGEYDDLVGK